MWNQYYFYSFSIMHILFPIGGLTHLTKLGCSWGAVAVCMLRFASCMKIDECDSLIYILARFQILTLYKMKVCSYRNFCFFRRYIFVFEISSFFLKKLKWSLFKTQRIPVSTRNAWLGDLSRNIQRKSVSYICGTPKQTPMHQIQTSTNKPKTPSTEGPPNQ